ncbi:MAG TPA: hypothetical protein VKB93_03720 [Thermoanaerobaculia bacterium]|nr:hypothetical protein [Thermoanaerobaculia bacterium]
MSFANDPLVDKALSLDQQAKTARQEAINALQNERKSIDEQLKVLDAAAATQAKPPKATDPNKVCSVCQERGHDGRFHKRKAPVSLLPSSAPKATAQPSK